MRTQIMLDHTVMLEFHNFITAHAWLEEQPDPVIFNTQLGLTDEEVKQGKFHDLAVPKSALHLDMEEPIPQEE